MLNVALVENDADSKSVQGDWSVFAEKPEFESAWWNHHNWDFERDHCLSALIGTAEVARVQLDEKVDLHNYIAVPPLERKPLEIELIEVATNRQGEGIGRAVVEELLVTYPTRRIVAFSKTDGFWSAIGWDRYEPRDPVGNWPLFVSPR